jgi:hypothetical protein
VGAVSTVMEFDAGDKPAPLYALIVTAVPGTTLIVNGEVVVFAFA